MPPAGSGRDSGAMSEPHGSRAAGSPGDFWTRRPARPQQGGKIAGVAAGVAQRYEVDPVLVRVVLVVLAFYGGSGIALYLLGWLLFPKEGDPGSEPSRSPSAVVLVLVGLLMIPVLLWTLRFPGIFGVVVGVGALYLLHRHRGGPPAPPAPDESSAAESSPHGAPSADPSTVVDDGTAEDEPPGRRWITLATLAAAAAAALVAGLAGAPVPMAVAVALAVLGAGLVLGSFLRGGRPLLLFAVPVGLVALLLGAPGTWFPGAHDDGAGISEHPTTTAELRPDYRTSSGGARLDLSDLNGAAPARTHVDTSTGQVRVLVPRNADVLANCSSASGDVDCLGDNGGREDSPDRSEQVNDPGPDGPGGGSIQLDVRSQTGDVEVTRD